MKQNRREDQMVFHRRLDGISAIFKTYQFILCKLFHICEQLKKLCKLLFEYKIIQKNTHTHTHTLIHTHTHTHAHSHSHAHTHTHTYIHTYRYIHAHTYKHSQKIMSLFASFSESISNPTYHAEHVYITKLHNSFCIVMKRSIVCF